MKFVHTNIITDNWRKLADFYIKVFDCKPVLPERDLKAGHLPMRPFKDIRVVALGTREDIDVTEADGSTHEGL